MPAYQIPATVTIDVVADDEMAAEGIAEDVLESVLQDTRAPRAGGHGKGWTFTIDRDDLRDAVITEEIRS